MLNQTLIQLHGLLCWRRQARKMRGKYGEDNLVQMELYYIELDIDQLLEDINIGEIRQVLKTPSNAWQFNNGFKKWQ